MKINEDCVKDVLEYFVENLSIKITRGKNGFKCDFDRINMQTVMDYFSDKYSKEDIWYSIYNLEKEYYIETNNVREKSRTAFGVVDIYNVTHKGHTFYETITPQPVWDKTKSVISKIGVHTLSFIESVARDIAVETSKQMVSTMVK